MDDVLVGKDHGAAGAAKNKEIEDGKYEEGKGIPTLYLISLIDRLL